MERSAQFHTKLVQARVGDRHKPLDLDQIDGTAVAAARSEKGAPQPLRREALQDPRTRDVRRAFDRQQGAVEAALLKHAPADCQCVGTIATGVAAGTEREAGDDLHRALVDRQQVAPPGVRFTWLWHRQDTNRGFPVGDGTDHLADGIIGRHWRVAAVVVPRQIPKPLPITRSEYSNRKRGLQPDRRRQHLPPHPNEGCDREGAMVTSDKSANDLDLACWLKRRLVAVFLAGRDHRHDLRPIDQKVVQPVIDLVETPAQAFKIGRGGGHGFVRCSGRRTSMVATRQNQRTKIKENVDMPDRRSLVSAPNREPAAPVAAGRCATELVYWFRDIPVPTLTSPRLRSRSDQDWPGYRLLVREPLRLDCGIDFGPFTIAYQTYGKLNPDRSNAIMVCH